MKSHIYRKSRKIRKSEAKLLADAMAAAMLSGIIPYSMYKEMTENDRGTDEAPEHNDSTDDAGYVQSGG
jgi:hypothetical protein